jgi:uncharacterized protein YndB with AHSA1/START domain
LCETANQGGIMPLQKDVFGRRSVQVEVEVPGTPEEVWEAIATGPGVSAWFVPTEVEEREGKPVAVKSNFGPGMESLASVTAWDPPRRFAADSQDLGPNAPNVATEWIVEARSGGTCVVRVVHSLFASTDDWDNQLEGWEHGWPGFFRILRLYLTYFRGQCSSAFQLGSLVPQSKFEAWVALTAPLKLARASKGEQVRSPASAPLLTGLVERVGEGAYAEELLLRLEEPTPGITHLFAMDMGGQVYLSIRFYLYGDAAAEAVARHEPLWRAWMKERFPASGEASDAAGAGQ